MNNQLVIELSADNRWFPGFDFVTFGACPSIVSPFEIEDEDDNEDVIADGAD